MLACVGTTGKRSNPLLVRGNTSPGDCQRKSWYCHKCWPGVPLVASGELVLQVASVAAICERVWYTRSCLYGENQGGLRVALGLVRSFTSRLALRLS